MNVKNDLTLATIDDSNDGNDKTEIKERTQI